MKLYGAHIDSDINNIIHEAKIIKSYGGNLIQIFVDIKQDKNKYYELKKELKKINMRVSVHASYTINIAQNWDEYSWWVKQFILEIEYAEAIGAFGIVVHLGKQLKLTKEEGLNNMYSSLLYIYNKTKNLKVKIMIETSTGQGSEMCYNLEDFAYFFNKFLKINKDKFRVCLDTCHIFQAGYNIKEKKNILKYFNMFNKSIGLEYIGLVHLNDSKNKLGAKLDRHESIGYGYIGKENIKIISEFFFNYNTPIVLETPDKSKIHDELKFIWQ